MFSCQSCEISKNIFFTEHIRATASKYGLKFWSLWRKWVTNRRETHFARIHGNTTRTGNQLKWDFRQKWTFKSVSIHLVKLSAQSTNLNPEIRTVGINQVKQEHARASDELAIPSLKLAHPLLLHPVNQTYLCKAWTMVQDIKLFMVLTWRQFMEIVSSSGNGK